MPPLSAAVLAVDHARAAGAPRKRALARRRLINELITSLSSLQTSSRQTAPALRSGRLLHTHTHTILWGEGQPSPSRLHV